MSDKAKTPFQKSQIQGKPIACKIRQVDLHKTFSINIKSHQHSSRIPHRLASHYIVQMAMHENPPLWVKKVWQHHLEPPPCVSSWSIDANCRYNWLPRGLSHPQQHVLHIPIVIPKSINAIIGIHYMGILGERPNPWGISASAGGKSLQLPVAGFHIAT